MQTIYVHIANEEAFIAEVEELPDPKDAFVACMNPRKRDGKDLHYVLAEVSLILVPWHRINFIEVMPSGEDEEVFTFVREK
jgi:hypothetical protein